VAPKKYKLRSDDIRPLIQPMGGCIASDRITVDGARVGSMVRDPSERDDDSGWCFFAGDESQDYLDDPENLAVYHVNTVANYDPAIIPYLYALPGARFDREPNGDAFLEAEDSAPDARAERLPRGITVVGHRVNLDDRWAIELPTPFRRRIEDGSLVLWRPCLTLWLAFFEAPKRGDDLLELVRGLASPAAIDVRTARGTRGVTVLSYRLHEDSTDARVPSLYAFVVGARGYVQLGIFADREEDIAAARDIVSTIAPR
jgi:hypothetical protein